MNVCGDDGRRPCASRGGCWLRPSIPPLTDDDDPDDDDEVEPEAEVRPVEEPEEVTEGSEVKISVGMMRTSPAELVTMMTVAPPSFGGDRLISGGIKPPSTSGTSVEKSVVSSLVITESVGRLGEMVEDWPARKDSFRELSCSGLRMTLDVPLAKDVAGVRPATKDSFKELSCSGLRMTLDPPLAKDVVGDRPAMKDCLRALSCSALRIWLPGADVASIP